MNNKLIERIRELVPEIFSKRMRISVDGGLKTRTETWVLDKPITLAVVLRAIGITIKDIHPIYFVSDGGLFWKEDWDVNREKIEFHGIGLGWDLTKDNLLDQSEETQDFIASILGVQKVNNQEGE
jgi:hypothetical protein